MDTSTLMTIGDFSRATNLTVKTLRHYHSVGLLEPAGVDRGNGYRQYAPDQLPTAQVIRRLRDLEMPIDDVRAVIGTTDVAERNALIAAHLDRLEGQLRQTQASVAALRGLLAPPGAPRAIEHRTIDALVCLTITAIVTRSDLSDWWVGAQRELHDRVVDIGAAPIGPIGGLYANEVFNDDAGTATMFVPVAAGASFEAVTGGVGGVRQAIVPGGDFAVVIHHGSHDEIDLSYGTLGAHVARHALGVEGPVREHYVVGVAETDDVSAWVTEICWPIFRTAMV